MLSPDTAPDTASGIEYAVPGYASGQRSRIVLHGWTYYMSWALESTGYPASGGFSRGRPAEAPAGPTAGGSQPAELTKAILDLACRTRIVCLERRAIALTAATWGVLDWQIRIASGRGTERPLSLVQLGGLERWMLSMVLPRW